MLAQSYVAYEVIHLDSTVTLLYKKPKAPVKITKCASV